MGCRLSAILAAWPPRLHAPPHAIVPNPIPAQLGRSRCPALKAMHQKLSCRSALQVCTCALSGAAAHCCEGRSRSASRGMLVTVRT